MGTYFDAIKIIPHFYIIRFAESSILGHALKTEGDPLLDLGCGDGSFGATLGVRGAFGVDIDRDAVARLPLYECYRGAVCADARMLPYRDGAFRTVFSNCAIEHMDGIEDVLSEVTRVLARGGTFVFTVPTRVFVNAVREDAVLGTLALNRSERIEEYNRLHHHVNILEPGEWEARLKAAGLRVESCSHYLPGEIGSFVARMDMLYTVEAPGSKEALKRLERKYKFFRSPWLRLRVRRYLNGPLGSAEGTHAVIRAVKK